MQFPVLVICALLTHLLNDEVSARCLHNENKCSVDEDCCSGICESYKKRCWGDIKDVSAGPSLGLSLNPISDLLGGEGKTASLTLPSAGLTSSLGIKGGSASASFNLNPLSSDSSEDKGALSANLNLPSVVLNPVSASGNKEESVSVALPSLNLNPFSLSSSKGEGTLSTNVNLPSVNVNPLSTAGIEEASASDSLSSLDLNPFTSSSNKTKGTLSANFNLPSVSLNNLSSSSNEEGSTSISLPSLNLNPFSSGSGKEKGTLSASMSLPTENLNPLSDNEGESSETLPSLNLNPFSSSSKGENKLSASLKLPSVSLSPFSILGNEDRSASRALPSTSLNPLPSSSSLTSGIHVKNTLPSESLNPLKSITSPKPSQHGLGLPSLETSSINLNPPFSSLFKHEAHSSLPSFNLNPLSLGSSHKKASYSVSAPLISLNPSSFGVSSSSSNYSGGNIARCAQVDESCRSAYDCCSHTCDMSSGLCVPYGKVITKTVVVSGSNMHSSPGSVLTQPKESQVVKEVTVTTNSNSSKPAPRTGCFKNWIGCKVDEDCCSYYCSHKDQKCHHWRIRRPKVKKNSTEQLIEETVTVNSTTGHPTQLCSVDSANCTVDADCCSGACSASKGLCELSSNRSSTTSRSSSSRWSSSSSSAHYRKQWQRHEHSVGNPYSSSANYSSTTVVHRITRPECIKESEKCQENKDCCSNFCEPGLNICRDFDEYLADMERRTSKYRNGTSPEVQRERQESQIKEWKDTVNELKGLQNQKGLRPEEQGTHRGGRLNQRAEGGTLQKENGPEQELHTVEKRIKEMERRLLNEHSKAEPNQVKQLRSLQFEKVLQKLKQEKEQIERQKQREKELKKSHTHTVEEQGKGLSEEQLKNENKKEKEHEEPNLKKNIFEHRELEKRQKKEYQEPNEKPAEQKITGQIQRGKWKEEHERNHIKGKQLETQEQEERIAKHLNPIEEELGKQEIKNQGEEERKTEQLKLIEEELGKHQEQKAKDLKSTEEELREKQMEHQEKEEQIKTEHFKPIEKELGKKQIEHQEPEEERKAEHLKPIEQELGKQQMEHQEEKERQKEEHVKSIGEELGKQPMEYEEQKADHLKPIEEEERKRQMEKQEHWKKYEEFKNNNEGLQKELNKEIELLKRVMQTEHDYIPQNNQNPLGRFGDIEKLINHIRKDEAQQKSLKVHKEELAKEGYEMLEKILQKEKILNQEQKIIRQELGQVQENIEERMYNDEQKNEEEPLEQSGLLEDWRRQKEGLSVYKNEAGRADKRLKQEEEHLENRRYELKNIFQRTKNELLKKQEKLYKALEKDSEKLKILIAEQKLSPLHKRKEAQSKVNEGENNREELREGMKKILYLEKKLDQDKDQLMKKLMGSPKEMEKEEENTNQEISREIDQPHYRNELGKYLNNLMNNVNRNTNKEDEVEPILRKTKNALKEEVRHFNNFEKRNLKNLETEEEQANKEIKKEKDNLREYKEERHPIRETVEEVRKDIEELMKLTKKSEETRQKSKLSFEKMKEEYEDFNKDMKESKMKLLMDEATAEEDMKHEMETLSKDRKLNSFAKLSEIWGKESRKIEDLRNKRRENEEKLEKEKERLKRDEKDLKRNSKEVEKKIDEKQKSVLRALEGNLADLGLENLILAVLENLDVKTPQNQLVKRIEENEERMAKELRKRREQLDQEKKNIPKEKGKILDNIEQILKREQHSYRKPSKEILDNVSEEETNNEIKDHLEKDERQLAEDEKHFAKEVENMMDKIDERSKSTAETERKLKGTLEGITSNLFDNQQRKNENPGKRPKGWKATVNAAIRSHRTPLRSEAVKRQAEDVEWNVERMWKELVNQILRDNMEKEIVKLAKGQKKLKKNLDKDSAEYSFKHWQRKLHKEMNRNGREFQNNIKSLRNALKEGRERSATEAFHREKWELMKELRHELFRLIGDNHKTEWHHTLQALYSQWRHKIHYLKSKELSREHELKLEEDINKSLYEEFMRVMLTYMLPRMDVDWERHFSEHSRSNTTEHDGDYRPAESKHHAPSTRHHFKRRYTNHGIKPLLQRSR